MYVSTDFVLNGAPIGNIAEGLADVNYDVGLRRPFFDDKGRNCVLVNSRKKNKEGKIIYEKALVSDLVQRGMTQLVHNTTSLMKEQWVTLTNRVIAASRERLRAWSDLAAAAPYGGFDGMGTLALEYQTISDAGEAVMDMDAMTEGRNDTFKTQLEGLPLPITHSDFWYPERLLAVSRKNGTPLNTRMAEMAARRVAEKVESTLIGTSAAINVGGSAAAGFAGLPYGRAPRIYGYLNFPDRITKTDLTTPTGSNPEATVSDVLEMLELARGANFYGPFMLYHSTDWDVYLDNDYARLGGDNASQTLRDRLRRIDGIKDVKRLDFLRAATDPFTLLLVQMTSEVAQAVEGMGITVVQWPSMGGMRINFKVMCIQVPLITSDYNGNTGIVHATTS